MKLHWIVLILFAAAVLLWLWLIRPALRRPPALKALRQFRYAHRGLHNIAAGVPENSGAAFRLAVEQGFGIELDVRLSRDGRLVVEHDPSLLRTCGVDRTIEKSTWSQLRSLRLEGTEERLLLLEEVFALVAGRVPLLIELKTAGGNQAALSRAVWQALQKYSGPYCIESFEPRVLLWFRRNAPRVVRGQLSGYVRRGGALIAPAVDFILRNLWIHLISRPHFVAYNYLDRQNLSFQVCRLLFRAPVFFWTIRSPEGEKIAARYHATPIFEITS